MKSFSLLLFLTTILTGILATDDKPIDYKTAKSVYDFTVKDIKGNEINLDKYKGHVLLIVNVATNCTLTDRNYAQLNDLYAKYGDSKGLKILAFPCNQFAEQEPGTDQEIANFADHIGVKFDMFSKIEVNGDNAIPLYKYLKLKQPGEKENDSSIEWNFTKFIVDKNGQPVERYNPQIDPKDVAPHLEKYFD